MMIELLGGPADGIVLQVPAEAIEWIVPTPLMTPAQFIALETGGPSSDAGVPVLEHIYITSKNYGRRTMARLFTYRGSRRVPTRKEPS